MNKSKRAKKLSLSKETLKKISGGTQPEFISRCCDTGTPTEVGCDETAEACTIITVQL